MSTVLDALISTADASAANYALIGPKVMTRRQEEVYGLVTDAHRDGVVDMSTRELQQRWEAVHDGKRIEASTLSSTVHSMVASGRLRRTTKLRRCLVTGKTICPFFAPLQQAALIN